MKTATLIARILLGLMFVVFGLNGFLHFIPMPPPPKGPAGEFAGALFSTGYLNVVMALQLVGGLLVLSGRFLPLGGKAPSHRSGMGTRRARRTGWRALSVG